MKLTRIVVLCLALLPAWAGLSQAQIDCDAIEPWSTDSAIIVNKIGEAGDTVWVPLLIVNTMNVAAISINLEFDSTLIKPLVWYTDVTIDTSYYLENCRDTVIGTDTVVVCDTLQDPTIDTLTISNYHYNLLPHFDSTYHYPQVVDEVDFPPSAGNQRIKFLGLPKAPMDFEVAFDSGRGRIVEIGFEIDSMADSGAIATIGFYKETIYNDSLDPQPIGCIFSHYTNDSGTYTAKFTTIGGYVEVGVPPVLPVINSFYANPDDIYQGNSTTLYWNVSDADSVVISSSQVGRVDAFTNLIHNTTLYPQSSQTYYLTAWKGVESITSSGVPVTVTEPGENNRPVFTAPTQTFYEIDQGQTVAFQVTATDADNDQITLTATSLPNNAAFGPTNPVIGVGSVTGNFSFTPDFVQLGTYQAAFTADDGKPGGSQQLTVSIQVNEIPYDRLFTTSAEGQVPVGGLAGTPQVLLPINLITAQTVYGVQFDFFYNEQYFEVDSFITTPRTEDYVIYDDIGGTPGEIRVVTFGVANEPIVTDTASTAILYAVMSIDTVAPWGDYLVYIDNGWESVTPDPDFPSLWLVTDSGIIQVDRLGDVNLDKRVDVADAVNIVGYILGNYGFNSRQFSTADVIVDVTIDVFDLVGIINLIYGIPPSSTAGHYIGGDMATVSLDYPDLHGGLTDVMVVRSELPAQIAGVQLEIRYDPSSVILGKPTLGEDATRMVLSSKDDGDGKLTVLLYFKNPFRTEDLIQVGQADLVEVPIAARSEIEFGDESQMKLTKALLSTASAEAVRVEGIDRPLPSAFVLHQNYPNPFNPTTAIEFSLGGTDDGSLTQHVKLDIYNILGQHVKTLVDKDMIPGNYQVDWDATSSSSQRVATGIYLYKLQVGQESKSKKMLLLK